MRFLRHLICTTLLFIPVLCQRNNKRGLAYPSNNNPGDILNVNQTSSSISWIYDWGLTAPDNLASSNIEYIPMQWGGGNIENFAAAVKKQNVTTILAFNEPDFEVQANMDPRYAAELWQQYIQPLKADGIRLGGPAVTSAGSGQPWLTRFFEACSNCTIDFLPLHWYGSGVEGFYDYIHQMHSVFPYPVWITEYADTSLDPEDVATFLNQTTKYLDELEWVERYAWFGYFRPENTSAYSLLDEEGGLNRLGRAYIGANTFFKSGKLAVTTTAVHGGPTEAYKTISVPTDVTTPTITPSAAPPRIGGLSTTSCLTLVTILSITSIGGMLL